MFTFSDKLPYRLPPMLEDIKRNALSPVDADMILLASLVSMSACLPNVQGTYGRRVVYPNLFLFVSAPASAGKGRLMLARRIVDPIHREVRQKYNDELMRLKAEMEEKGKPTGVDVYVPQTMLFLPANSSATALYQTLNDCGGSGLIFETEADTLATALKSDYGNFSDGLRKAFHHEPISYNRRKEREYVEIQNPRLSVVLAGTPRQILNLMPDAENGLFSRFLMYRAKIKLEWLDMFEETEFDDNSYFDHLGSRFYSMYKMLKNASQPVNFVLTDEQKQRFNQCFAKWQEELMQLFGEQIVPSVRRLGLIAYRLAMILTTLGLEPYGCEMTLTRMVCPTEDFENAISIVEHLLDHIIATYSELPGYDEVTDDESNIPPLCNVLFDELPREFNAQQLCDVSKQLSIPHTTSYRYMRKLIDIGKINKLRHNLYQKQLVFN